MWVLRTLAVELGQIGSLLAEALQLPLLKGFLVVLVLLIMILATVRLS